MTGLTDYRDKVAVVTGASSGIGAALARELARRGMRIALVARRAGRLEQLALELRDLGGRTSVHVCDVSRRDAVEQAAGEVTAAWGGVDLLVNNAGYARHVLFKDHDLGDIEQLLATNTLGAIYWLKKVLPSMRARGRGWIVNLSSFAGKVGQPDEAAYSATKFAISGLSQALRHELAPLGIHVLCVHPVLVRTEMFTPEVLERMPQRSKRLFIDRSEFVAQTLRALERGAFDVTIPRRYRWIPVLHDLFPNLLGRVMARTKLEPLEDLTA